MSDNPAIVERKFQLLVEETNSNRHKPGQNCNCRFCAFVDEVDQRKKRRKELEEEGPSQPPDAKKQYRIYHFLKAFDHLEYFSRNWQANPIDLVKRGEDIEVLSKKGWGNRFAVTNRIRSYIQAEIGKPQKPEKLADRIIRNSLGLGRQRATKPIDPTDPLGLDEISPEPVITPPPIVPAPKVLKREIFSINLLVKSNKAEANRGGQSSEISASSSAKLKEEQLVRYKKAFSKIAKIIDTL